MQLVDAVIELHRIAALVETEVGRGQLSSDIRAVADRLHVISVDQNRAAYAAEEIIKQAREQ
jgi:hypothetical protein